MTTDSTDRPYNVPSLPVAVNIASSTNTSPIAVTTSSPHGVETGESVMVHGHTGNTAANGAWRAIRSSANVLLLVGSTGSGVGGASGTVHNQCFGSSVAVPADGDDPTATILATPSEALQDRTALLLKIIGWQQNIYKGGTTSVYGEIEVKDDGLLAFDNGSSLLAASGSQSTWLAGSEVFFEGEVTFDTTSDVTFDDGDLHLKTVLQVEGDGVIDVEDHGAGTSGFINIRPNGVLKVYEDGLIRVDDGGFLNVFGTATIESGGTLTLAFNGTFHQNGETIREGPVQLFSDVAATGIRWQKFDGAGGHEDGDQGLAIFGHRWDRIGVPTLTDDREWRLKSPTDPFLAGCAHMVTIYRGSNTDNALTIRDDDSNDLLGTFPDGSVGNGFACFIWDPEDAKWKTVGATPV
jgi:hypothetical protein